MSVLKQSLKTQSLAKLPPSFSRSLISSQKKISPLALATEDSPGRIHEARHLQAVNSFILKIAHGRDKRGMVFLPPRHGKSTLISEYGSAWYIGRFPDHRVMLTSYEADFASSWGRKARSVLERNGAAFDVKIDARSSAANRWDLTGRYGGMNTSGIGGAQTGKGANLFIIDDPIKNAKEARSPVIQFNNFDWYQSTAYTRLEPHASIFIIMTRWHEADLAGMILEESDEEWEVLRLPAIAEADDPLGREPGEALWPERYPIERLLQIKEEIGDYWFEAMFQGQPGPETGGLLKREWLQYYTGTLPKDPTAYTVYQGWDLAISEKDTADFTVCTTIAVDNVTQDVYVLDWYREHVDFPSQVEAVKMEHDRWNPSIVGIETVAYQKALPQQVLTTRALPIKDVDHTADKTARIQQRFLLFANRKIYLPENHPHLKAFESEFIGFNNARYDDMLDATEVALSFASRPPASYPESTKTYEFSGWDYIHGNRRPGRRS